MPSLNVPYLQQGEAGWCLLMLSESRRLQGLSILPFACCLAKRYNNDE